jgi:hypothetical protein
LVDRTGSHDAGCGRTFKFVKLSCGGKKIGCCDLVYVVGGRATSRGDNT